MKRAARIVAIAALLVGAGILGTYEMGQSLPPCASEDSDNCYWDADKRANGEGRDFYVVDGEVTYVD